GGSGAEGRSGGVDLRSGGSLRGSGVSRCGGVDARGGGIGGRVAVAVLGGGVDVRGGNPERRGRSEGGFASPRITTPSCSSFFSDAITPSSGTLVSCERSPMVSAPSTRERMNPSTGARGSARSRSGVRGPEGRGTRVSG